MPTEANCAPYTDNQPSIKPNPIKTNIFPTYTEPPMSMKLEIPYDLNATHTLINVFNQYKNMPSSNFLLNYVIAVCEDMLQFNYVYINTLMNLMNTIFPESLILALGPVMCIFMYLFGFILNMVFFIFTWFSNMHWMFRTNMNDSGEGPPKWSEVTWLSPINWWLGCWMVMFMTIVFMFGFLVISAIPISMYHVAIASLVFYRGILNGKEVSAFHLIKDTLIHYKVSIVTIISIAIVMIAFTKLGNVAGMISLVIMMLIYFGLVSTSLYQPIPESHLSPITTYQQAMKTCGSRNANRSGFLYNMFAGQQGGSVVKDLKKIGKMMSNHKI
ncbi:MAG: hypothetical protein ACOVRN_04120 [Flavobacterium sp.]